MAVGLVQNLDVLGSAFITKCEVRLYQLRYFFNSPRFCTMLRRLLQWHKRRFSLLYLSAMKRLFLYIALLALSVVPLSGILGAQVSTEDTSKPITISYLSPDIRDDLIYLSMQANFDLPDFLITAVNTGIQLNFIADVEILKQRALLPNEKLLVSAWHKKLHFHALTRHYVVEDLSLNWQANFNSLKSALVFLGRYNNMTVTEKSSPTLSQATHMRVRIKLSRADLPLLLRLKSYLLYSAPLSSNWHQWSL